MVKYSAMVRISKEILKEALHLPADVDIVMAFQKPEDVLKNSFHIIVAHQNLPKLLDDNCEPKVLSLDELIGITAE